MNGESIQLSLLDEEIARELEAVAQGRDSAENGEGSEYDKINNVSRTEFVIRDFDTPRDKEMAVFTHAKKLSEYIFVITEKSPKKLRWSIVSRLQNISTELIENLYRANYEREEGARTEYQKRATVCLNLMDFYTETAKRMKAINLHQMSVIARQIGEVNKLLKGWIKSGKRA